MELTDKVLITLTFEGAKYLNDKEQSTIKALQERGEPISEDHLNILFPRNYHDGMIVEFYLWEVFARFGGDSVVDNKTPFINLIKIDVRPRCSCRTSINPIRGTYPPHP